MFKALSQRIKTALNRAAPGLYTPDERLGDVVDSIGRRTNLKKRIVAGAAAGALAVAGIEPGDEIIAVTRYNSGVPSDLTSEFTVTGAGTVSNTGGTATTGSQLEFLFHDLT